MTLTAFFLLGIAAFTHAGWNLIGKRRHPSVAFFFLANVVGTAVVLLFVLLFAIEVISGIPSSVWLLLAISGPALGLYTITLAAAYKEGDLSLVYPLSRGASVCLITVGGIFVGGSDTPGLWFCTGMAVLSLGCILLPLRQFREFEVSRFANRSCALAMVAAAGIAGYTILDSVGLHLLETELGDRFSNTALSATYLAMEGSISCLCTALYVAGRRNERRLVAEILKDYRASAILSGIGIYLTYGLVLMSMKHVSNVSYVGALRQLSIPIGAAMGILLLKEPRYTPRVLGVIMVTGGIAITALV